MKLWKRITSCFLSFAVAATVMCGRFCVESCADNLDTAFISNSQTAFNNNIEILKSNYFIDGEYWNYHNGYGSYGSTSPMHTGTNACPSCSSRGKMYCVGDDNCYNNDRCGRYYLNGVFKSEQCQGFAQLLGHLLFGGDPHDCTNGWYKEYNTSKLYPGDIAYVSMSGITHAIFITSVNGNAITYADCNAEGPCMIKWNYCPDVTNPNAYNRRGSIIDITRYNNNPFLNSTPADTTPPVVSNAKVELDNITSLSFIVNCNVSDNVAVTSMKVGVWSSNVGIDNAVWYDDITPSNGYAWAFITLDKFNYAYGTYYANIWAWDAAGNGSCNAEPLTININSATAPTQTQATIKDGTYSLVNDLGYAMDVWNGRDENNTPLQNYTYSKNNVSQQFKFVHQGGGKYKIYSVLSNDTKAVSFPSYSDGSNIVIATANGAQLFYVVPLGNGKYAIESADKDNYVIGTRFPTAAGDVNNTDTRLYLQKYLTNSPSQRWTFRDLNGNAVNPVVSTDISSCTISGVSSSYEYTGSAINPIVTVKSGNTTLKNGTDYTVSYGTNNTNVGTNTGSVTVTGKGNYSGSITKKFSITAVDINKLTISGVSSSYEYTGSAINPIVTVKSGNTTLKNGTDYTVSYGTNNTNFGTNTGSVTVTGKGNYSGSVTKKFSITAVDINKLTISGVSSSYEYTGSAINPIVTVKSGNTTLKNGTDYTVSYGTNNTNVGTNTGSVTVTGKGSYSGSVTKKFSITTVDINKLTISGVSSSYEYTGSAIKPTISVTYGGKTLTENSDYTVSYENNVDIGTATVSVTGKGNFTGSVTKYFYIVGVPKTVKSITVVAPKHVPKFYTGDAFDPTGYTLTVTYDDKTTDKNIPLTLDMISGYDPYKSGSQKLTVTYGGKTAILTVTVTELKATALSIAVQPKTKYYLYDAIDLSAGIFNVTYNSGKSEEVPMTDTRVTPKGFDSTKTGTKKVTITLLGKSVTINMEIAVDPDNAPVVVGTNGYETIADALKYNTTGDIEIVVNCDLVETKAVTFPKALTSATLKTADGKTLTLSNLTITANCDLTIDAAIEPAKTGKTLTIKSVADKKVTITRLDSSLPLTLSGTKTTDFMLATGKTIDIAAANTVNVDIADGTTVRLTKVTFKPTKLTGAGTLEVNDASTVTITDVKDSNIILNQYNKISGKNTTVMLPKLTIGTASNANITVYDTGAALADISGKSVFTLAKNSTDSVVPGITIVNKSGTNTLSPVPYKKDVRAEWTGALTMTCNGAPTAYSSFEKALEAITANAKTLPNADYVITMNESVAVTKFALPAKAGSLTIDGNGNALTLTGITNIAPKYAFTLNNIALHAQTNKGVANVLTINCSTGDTVIDGLAFTGKSLTIKGGSKNELTLGTCSAINSLTGYTTITINAPVEIEKTLTATNLTLGASANVKFDKGATLTVNKVLTGTSGANITLVDGFKPIALKGTKLDETIKGDKISLVSTDGTKFDEKQIFATKLDLYGKFDVTGIASDASYDLALQSGKAYLKAFTLEMNGKQYAFWNDVITDIDKIKNPNADYTITLLADFDIGATLKLPGKGKYHSLTIDGNGYKLTFVGNTASLTGITTLKNITITALKLNTKTKIYDSVAWTLTKNKFTLDKVGTVDLINCNEKP